MTEHRPFVTLGLSFQRQLKKMTQSLTYTRRYDGGEEAAAYAPVNKAQNAEQLEKNPLSA